MKLNRFFILLLFFLPGIIRAQITLEKVYNYSLTSTKINQTDYKYYLMDVSNSQCRIYDTNHTLWKTINIALPSNYYLFDIKFVTQSLFNSDNSVELWYSAYEWVATGTSTGYYRYISKVISENGAVLASITGGAYAYIIQTASEQYKLAVYAYDNSVSPYTVQTYIFSLPASNTAAWYVAAALENPYPNPAAELIHIPVSPEWEGGSLQIYSVSGQKISENTLPGGPVYHLNTRNWSPGVYTYRLIRGGKYSESKQFIVR